MAGRSRGVDDLVSGAATAGPAFDGCYRDQDVVVTGHMGFKGGWLSLWLRHLGARVHGYSREAPSVPSLFETARLAEVLDHTVGDVRDLVGVRALLQRTRPRFVFHLAAQAIVSRSYTDPVETMSSNAMGTTMVLEALRSVTWPCAAIFVTSDKCYDNVEWPWGYRETDRLGGKDVYSGSKAAAEMAIRCYVNAFFAGPGQLVRLAVGRAGNVIGGGDWAIDRIVVDCVKAWGAGQRVQLRCPAATRPWQHVLEPLSGYLALGQDLAARPAQHGEAFNFGPATEQNRTVVEVLDDLARFWDLGAGQRAYDIVTGEQFHEAGLLKLNCDKALQVLRWRPTLAYRECVTMTGEWYRRVLREQADARSLTMAQIELYEALAAERELPWRHGAGG